MRGTRRPVRAGRSFDRNDINRLLDIVQSWYRMIKTYRNSGKKYPEATISDLEASISSVLKDYGVSVGASTRTRKRRITAAVDGGWEVPDWRANEAYDLALEYGWTEEELDSDIVKTLSSEELASALAYIFRMNDFQEWNDYLDENPD